MSKSSLPSSHHSAHPITADRWGFTPLHNAAANGEVDSVRTLLLREDAGIFVYATAETDTGDKWTAQTYAEHTNTPQCAIILSAYNIADHLPPSLFKNSFTLIWRDGKGVKALTKPQLEALCNYNEHHQNDRSEEQHNSILTFVATYRDVLRDALANTPSNVIALTTPQTNSHSRTSPMH
jgi:hypothetical protein